MRSMEDACPAIVCLSEKQEISPALDGNRSNRGCAFSGPVSATKLKPSSRENSQECTEIRYAFTGFNPGYRGMRQSAKGCKIPLGKIEIMAPFDHGAYDLIRKFRLPID